MSVELVKESIKDFLKSYEPEVIAINGRWGVGKTFAWGKVIAEQKNDTALKSYAYVSLFGLSSLDELKKTICLSKIETKNIGKPFDIKKALRQGGNLVKSGKVPHFGSANSAFDAVLSYLSLSNTIICFDDIERHSDKLTIKDFLGLVSYLKEQKKCKVIILLNEDADGLTDFLKYKEKVIDKQLQYEPSAEECFDIAIKEHKYYQHVRDVCLRMDIRNIRVLNKIQVHIASVLHFTEQYDEAITNQIIQTIIILCWSYYCHSSETEQIPSIEYIKNLHSRTDDEAEFSAFIQEEGESELSKESKWEQKLISYNYPVYDPLSAVLLASIERGFVDKGVLKKVCNEKQKDIVAYKANEAYSRAWAVFHHSFDTNEDEVKVAMDKGLRSAVKNLSVSQYSSGVGLIRDIGDEESAEQLTQFFIDNNKSDIDKLNVNSWDSSPYGVKDEKFGIRVQAYYDSLSKADEPVDILKRRSGQNSYNQEEVAVLEKLSSKELKELFKSFKGEELTSQIRACLMLAGSSDVLMSNTRKALEDIGNESNLNKHRLAKFNR